jgi:hypothetical protein
MAEVWLCSHNLGVPILARHLDHLLRFVLWGRDVEAPVVHHLAHLLVDVRLLGVGILLPRKVRATSSSANHQPKPVVSGFW